MTQTAQDFATYAGDDSSPIVTLVDGNGAPINISTVLEIVWIVRTNIDSPAVITKKLSTGQITLPGGGTDGRFQIAIAKTDTAPLNGYYLHTAAITDNQSQVSTVMTGRLRVGQKPVWSYSGDPSTSNKDAVRYLIGDTVSTDTQIMDQEINFALSQRPSIYGAAAMCCRSLASRLSREADVSDRELRTSYSARARAYLRMANEFEMQATVRSGALPYAGGISVSDKQNQELNTDRVRPGFNIGMDTNFIPVGPAGNETQGQASDNSLAPD